ncbi:MAG TPA: hypothetical protein VG709_03740 [Actinomycetota bacterium]|nr:hypothetical protein [Actinomycetota bacterium]
MDVAHCDGSSAAGCVRFETWPRDSYVRVSVTDASNTGPVLASVAQDLDADGAVEPDEHLRTFCGRSKRLWIRRPGKSLTVFVYEARGGVYFTYSLLCPVCPYVVRCTDRVVATTGTVKARFS